MENREIEHLDPRNWVFQMIEDTDLDYNSIRDQFVELFGEGQLEYFETLVDECLN